MSLQANPLHLPFASQSIEVLFSPFTLDLGFQQMPLLYEYDRVLKSMGIVIIVGVNRLGLWKFSRQLLGAEKNNSINVRPDFHIGAWVI